MALNEAIAERVRKFNPYHSGSLSDPNEKDVDDLIIQAAWQIQHVERKGKKKGKDINEKSRTD